ncbi:hypothetical protein [Algibacter sp. L4_22]|uniref:hypothetical protein n=1 Tax=Algibacter sp. L4_22 TaxID=2942477 RepID=UPI00201B6401|nr:hypothetical protein [Algibacter sp. L4_22]MCL5127753.1 hypothetical protein [Algibacter sp. L4_22]
MKNLIILLITLISFQFTNAQEFTVTSKYKVANRMDTKQQEYATALFDIVATDDVSMKVATLSILDLDLFEDVTITLLTDPNLDNINEIIKVDIHYSTCCYHAETYYYMITDTNDSISLPYIENDFCENTTTEVQYIFPVQKLGKEAIILKTEVSFTEKHTIKDLKVLQSFAWNDDDFNDNESVAYSGIDNN